MELQSEVLSIGRNRFNRAPRVVSLDSGTFSKKQSKEEVLIKANRRSVLKATELQNSKAYRVSLPTSAVSGKGRPSSWQDQLRDTKMARGGQGSKPSTQPLGAQTDESRSTPVQPHETILSSSVRLYM